MKYRCSHNDYWVEPQIIKAKYFGCNILEVDIKLIDDEIMLTHSWRPFKWLCYGRLIDYLEAAKETNSIIYIEFKEGSERLNEKLFDVLKRFNYIKFLVDAKNNLMNPNREKYMIDFFNQYCNKLDVQIKSVFEIHNNIEYVNLYDKKINHL